MFTLIHKINDNIDVIQQDLDVVNQYQSQCLEKLDQVECPRAIQDLEYYDNLELELESKLYRQRVFQTQISNYIRVYAPFHDEFDEIVRQAGFQLGHFPYRFVREGATKDEIRKAEANFENLAWARARREDVFITQCSIETTWRYIRRVMNIAKKENLRKFIACFIAKKNQTRGTFRWTRAALNFFLEMYMVCGRACDEIYDLHNKLNSVDTQKLPTRPQQQTYYRLKSVPEKTLAKFIDALPSRGRNGIFAAMFFQSTILLGLRPIEWQSAFISEEDDKVLVVKNAKYGNGRASGEHRYIHLHNFDDDSYELVRDTLYFVKLELMRIKFPSMMDWIRRAFRQTDENLFGKSKEGRITPYMGRHQFAANLKKALGPFKRDSLAALMGHSTDRTASFHYAHANQALKGGRFAPQADGTNIPVPDPANVALVRVTNSHLAAMELGASSQSGQSTACSASESAAYSSYTMSM